MKLTFFLLALFFGMWFVIISTTEIVMGIHFDQRCGGNLERAAHANTVELAHKEMKTALAYIEANKLTDGYTSVLYQTPDEDVGFWYNNMVSSTKELEKALTSTSQLEQSNVLMKLRETLVSHGEKGSENLNCPDGISRYPYNGVLGFLLLGSALLTAVFAGLFLLAMSEDW